MYTFPAGRFFPPWGLGFTNEAVSSFEPAAPVGELFEDRGEPRVDEAGSGGQKGAGASSRNVWNRSGANVVPKKAP